MAKILTGKAKPDKIRWHSCYCGCGGMETIYRGRYFWKGQILGSGPHHVFTTHTGNMGFHVGDFRFPTLKAVNVEIRKNYRLYPRVKPISWHPCPAGCSHLTAHFKGLQFWAKYDGFLRRFTLYRTHKAKQGQLLRRSELDPRVREIARAPRKPKRTKLSI